MGRVFDAFMVQQTIDERGATGPTVGYFVDEGRAVEAAKGQGWYGGAGSVSPVKMVEVHDQCYPVMRGHEKGVPREFLNSDLITQRKNLRREAYDKVRAMLTVHEIALLGIKVPD